MIVGTIGARPSCSGPLWRKLERQQTAAEKHAEQQEARARREAKRRLRAAEAKRLRLWHRSRPRRSAEEITADVAVAHGVTVEAMCGPRRTRRVANARFEAWFLLRTKRAMSYAQIAKRFGNRDHTTILHGIRRYCQVHGLPFPEAAVSAELAANPLTQRDWGAAA